MRTRRSVRSFKEQDIPQEEVEDLLQNTLPGAVKLPGALKFWAPSGNNLQA
ncbi:MAG: nitroreductase family protein [Coprothermobacterota bacterium]|nr:nitroreductase family protein [Coprothermobacterota bacterium]